MRPEEDGSSLHDVLAREDVDPSRRVERVAERLADDDRDVEEVLVEYGRSGTHVVAEPQDAFDDFVELCRAAADGGHAPGERAVVERTVASPSEARTLTSAVAQTDGLDRAQVEARRRLLRSIDSDDDGDGGNRPADGPGGDREGTDGERSGQSADEDRAAGFRFDRAGAGSEGGRDGETADPPSASETSTGDGDDAVDPDGSATGARSRAAASVSPADVTDPTGGDESTSSGERGADDGESVADGETVTEDNGDDSTPAESLGGVVIDDDGSTPEGDGSTVDEPGGGGSGSWDAGPGSTTEPTDGRSDAATPSDSDAPAEDPAADPSKHRTKRESPQSNDPTEQGAFSIPNYAQDLVPFEFVLEAGDDYVPAGVDGSGMVVLEDGEYVGIAHVQPRSWSIHTDTKKTEIISAFKSAFLSTLDFPVQIVSYPTRFDMSDHVDRLTQVVEENERRDRDSELVTIGRELYPGWLEEFIESNDMKQRQFYVIVRLSADDLSQFQSESQGFLATVGEKVPPLEPVVDYFDGDEVGVEVSQQQCLRELDARLRRIANGLHRLDVGVDRLDDRDEVMGVLYHYYNNERPVQNGFPTGPYSVADPDAPVPSQPTDGGGE